MIDVRDAEILQARRAAERAMMERETWIRVAAVLAKAIVEGGTVGVMGECAIIKRADFEAVPKAYEVMAEPRRIKTKDGEVDVEEDVVLVTVKKKAEAPTLVVARGA